MITEIILIYLLPMYILKWVILKINRVISGKKTS